MMIENEIARLFGCSLPTANRIKQSNLSSG